MSDAQLLLLLYTTDLCHPPGFELEKLVRLHILADYPQLQDNLSLRLMIATLSSVAMSTQ